MEGITSKSLPSCIPRKSTDWSFWTPPHPDIDEYIDFPDPPGFVNSLYKVAAVAADLGILSLADATIGPILIAPGIPKEIEAQYSGYTRSGQYIREYLREEEGYERLVDLSRKADDFGDLPVWVFSGSALNEKALRKRGMDPEKIRKARIEMQEDLATLSSDGEVFFLPGGHITIFTERGTGRGDLRGNPETLHQIEQQLSYSSITAEERISLLYCLSFISTL